MVLYGRLDISGRDIQAALNPLADTLACPQCKMAFRERVSILIAQWAAVRVSCDP
jgi:hypothetical protein